jgi:hypothetical protein
VAMRHGCTLVEFQPGTRALVWIGCGAALPVTRCARRELHDFSLVRRGEGGECTGGDKNVMMMGDVNLRREIVFSLGFLDTG